ncbi:MAG: helix-turn-helix domain-containing protein [Actinomycetota bacterium]|nr:helix-turn-helix domain-containing protein [Actinomycetota bacterium]
MTTLQQQAKALGDPTRHAIFRFISESATPVGVADINSQFPFNHNAIRQHLAKLVTAGLVTERRDQAGRPGRPRLVYTVAAGADSRWGLTGPYQRLSVLLAEIIETGDEPVVVGRRAGASLALAAAPAADPAEMMTEVMAQQGFEPELRRKARSADIVLQTCPFESAVIGHRETICTMHLGIAEGLAAGAGGNVTVTELVAKDPRKAQCRIRLRIAE